MSDETNKWLSGLGKGWHDIVRPLVEHAEANGFKIAQVKEKFGGLRFYMNSGYSSMSPLIEVAEKVCAVTCEECGKPGKLRSNDGYLQTLCDEHAGEDVKMFDTLAELIDDLNKPEEG